MNKKHKHLKIARETIRLLTTSLDSVHGGAPSEGKKSDKCPDTTPKDTCAIQLPTSNASANLQAC